MQPQKMEQAPVQPQKKEQPAAQSQKKEQAVAQPEKIEQATVQPEKKEQAAVPPHKMEQAAVQPQVKEQAPPPPPPAVPEVRAPGAPVEMKKTYKGKKITVSINNASLRDFVNVVAQMSGTKIELSPDINERLTLILQDIPWDQALEMVANYYGLNLEEREGTLYLTRHGKTSKQKSDN
jgi:hypothetical protein